MQTDTAAKFFDLRLGCEPLVAADAGAHSSTIINEAAANISIATAGLVARNSTVVIHSLTLASRLVVVRCTRS